MATSRKKLTIAITVPLARSLPPQKYGGIELMVHALSEELVKRGHNVYLLTTGDSTTAATIVPIFPKALESYPEFNQYDEAKAYFSMIAVPRIIQELNALSVDIVHNNFGKQFIPFFPLINAPVVHTIHTAIGAHNHIMYDTFPHANYVSISNYQRRKAPHIHYVDTVYHGIHLDPLEFSPIGGEPLLFLGRIWHDKGIKEAITIAKSVSMPIHIGARIDSESSQKYFASEIQHLVDNQHIVFLGEISGEQKSSFLNHGKALLAPILGEEAFGIYFIEAMACGTPVIAFARGSVPEVIKDGVTGFIVNPSDDDIRGEWIIKKTGIEGMIEAVKKIAAMPASQYQQMRQHCREYVEEKFTVEKMTDQYEKIYQKILSS